MTDLIKRDDVLLPCPFCGGEASDTGLRIWSKALLDTHWDDGSEITKAYFCNCRSCSVTNIVGNVGYPTKAEAIAAWNTRALPAVTVPTHRYAGESEASVYDRKGFPPIEIVNDPAAIREAAWVELAQIIRKWRNDVPMSGEECANAIIALIGETK